jgi:hypothetical protein
MRVRSLGCTAWIRVLALWGLATVTPVVATASGGDDPADLIQAFTAAYRAGDWQAAAGVGLRLVALEPDRPVHLYNLACVYARAGSADEAVSWLGQAAAGGFARAGYQVRLRVLPGTGHNFPRDTVRELSKALRFALGGSAPQSQQQRAR